MEILFVFPLGWLIAYFINYLADVLPVSLKLTQPTCHQCDQILAITDYLFLKPCPACHHLRSRRTWLVQIGFTALVGLLWLFPPGRLGFWIGAGLMAFFWLVAIIDLEYRLILSPISLAGAVIGLALGIWQKGWADTLLGGAAGFLIMLGLYYFGILFNRVMGKIRHEEITEVALGYGDVAVGGFLGLMLGWPEITGGLILAILFGGLTSAILVVGMLIARKYSPLTAIPYAPFLLLGAIVFLYIPKQ